MHPPPDDLTAITRGSQAYMRLLRAHRRHCRRLMGPALGDFVHGCTHIIVSERAWAEHEARTITQTRESEGKEP
jgi:hypothetical protein